MRIKKLLVLMLTACVMVSTVGCSPKTKDFAKDGTYSVSTKAHNGNINIDVTIKDTKISDIVVGEHSETPGVSDPAFDKVIPQIIGNQTIAVDAVAGCTVTSNAIKECVKLALVEAGADLSAFENPVDKATTEVKTIEKTADVVIIGAGGAGLSAAVSAVQNNASVIVVEKMPSAGGNTIRSAGYYNAVDPSRQEPLGIEDSLDLHISQTYEGGDKVANLDMIETLVNNAYPTLTWLEDLGVEFKDTVTACVGAIHERTHTPVIPLGSSYIDKYIEVLDSSKNSEIIYDTTANELIVTDGKVSGVTCTDTDGNTVVLNANNGVIIATGGFSANIEMREKYNKLWPTLDENLSTTNHPGATGDGIILGEQVGANLIDMEYIQLFPLTNPENGSTKGILNGDTSNLVYVNKDGKRFTNEGGRRDDICKAILEQEDSVFYTICDGKVYPTGDEVNLDGIQINKMVENGEIVKADSLEELAKELDMDPAILIAEIDEYNKALTSGEADKFGRTLYNETLTQAPFYARIQGPAVHHTMGGLEINVSAQVLNTDGEIIEGLYAAGEVTGGIHGSNRLGGNAIPDTAVFGKIAGENCALRK